MTSIVQEQALLELGAVDTTELLTLLECPVCLDHITPPVKQCVKGHLVCLDCFPRLPHCPTCRSSMSGERNLAMEQVSRLLQFPCRYHPMGCKISAPLNLKAEHERNCDYLQLKCPFHGQCSFSGSLNMVTPHLKTEHAVTPVPVQPNGTLFYRAKQFAKRNLWAFIYQWDKNMFRFLVKHIHASSVGRTDNCNLVVAHVQYIGPDSMAAQYAYQISLFDAERRTNGPKFEGIVSSTMKPLESQVSKDEVFVATTYTAREYTDQFGQLNFIITMRSLKEKEHKKRDSSNSRRHRTTNRPSNNTTSSQSGSSAAQAGPSTAGPGSAPAGPSTAQPRLAQAGHSTAGPSSAQAGPSTAQHRLAVPSTSQPSTSAGAAPQAGPSGVEAAGSSSSAPAPGPSTVASASAGNSSGDQSNLNPVNLTLSSSSGAGENNEVSSSPSTSTSSSPSSSSEASAVQSTSGPSPATSSGAPHAPVATTASTVMDTAEDMVVSTNPQL